MKVTFFLPAIATFMATVPDTFSVSAVKILSEIEDAALAVDMLPTDFAQLDIAAEVDDFLGDDEDLAQIDALSNWAAVDDDSFVTSAIPEQLLSQGSSNVNEDEAEEDAAEGDKKKKEKEPVKANRMWESTYKPGGFGQFMMVIAFLVFLTMFCTYYYVAV